MGIMKDKVKEMKDRKNIKNFICISLGFQEEKLGNRE